MTRIWYFFSLFIDHWEICRHSHINDDSFTVLLVNNKVRPPNLYYRYVIFLVNSRFTLLCYCISSYSYFSSKCEHFRFCHPPALGCSFMTFACRTGAIAPSRAATFGCCGDSSERNLRFAPGRFFPGHSEISISTAILQIWKECLGKMKSVSWLLICLRNKWAGLGRLRTSSFPVQTPEWGFARKG